MSLWLWLWGSLYLRCGVFFGAILTPTIAVAQRLSEVDELFEVGYDGGNSGMGLTLVALLSFFILMYIFGKK